MCRIIQKCAYSAISWSSSVHKAKRIFDLKIFFFFFLEKFWNEIRLTEDVWEFQIFPYENNQESCWNNKKSGYLAEYIPFRPCQVGFHWESCASRVYCQSHGIYRSCINYYKTFHKNTCDLSQFTHNSRILEVKLLSAEFRLCLKSE